MAYCYCSPSRDLWNGRRITAGTTPREAGITYLSGDMVMGSRGAWVFASQRTAALKGWETRRRLMAEAHARLMETAPAPVEHCADHPEEQAEEEVVVITITGTTPAETKTPAPVALLTR